MTGPGLPADSVFLLTCQPPGLAGPGDGGAVPVGVVTVLLFLQFLTRLTERFVLGVDMFVESLWKIWTEILDVIGVDSKCMCGGRRLFKALFYSSDSQGVDTVSAVGGTGDPLQGGRGAQMNIFSYNGCIKKCPSKMRCIGAA